MRRVETVPGRRRALPAPLFRRVGMGGGRPERGRGRSALRHATFSMKEDAVYDEDVVYLNRARAANIVSGLFAAVGALLVADALGAPPVLAVVAASVLIILVSLTDRVGAIWALVFPSGLLFIVVLFLQVYAFRFVYGLSVCDTIARILFLSAAYVAALYAFGRRL